MAMYDAPPIPTRRPVVHAEPPQLQPGDYVRIRGVPGDMPAHTQLEGAFGRIVRIAGASVVLEMDEPYTAGGLTHRLYYSSAYQLMKVETVGRMGARQLYDDSPAQDSGA
jgi:hypothetical protein